MYDDIRGMLSDRVIKKRVHVRIEGDSMLLILSAFTPFLERLYLECFYVLIATHHNVH